MAGAGLPEYRHRFYESALHLRPDQIFLFIFEGNDLPADFDHRPYDESFIPTDRGLEALEKVELPISGREQLAQWARERLRFDSAASLFDALEPFSLDPVQLRLIYLSSYGLGERPLRRPVLVEFLRERLRARRPTSRNRRRGSPEFYPRYRAIFKLPVEQRLDELADVLCRHYFGYADAAPCRMVLAEQDELFRVEVVAEPARFIYLSLAIEQALTAEVLRFEEPDPRPLASATREYLHFFDELADAAEKRGPELVVVMIPLASYGDADFRSFWRQMIDFQQYFAGSHARYAALKQRLASRVQVIDLSDFPEALNGGYWKFDGHWNEQGNQAVARLIAERIGSP